jgi:hypothetical protein
VATAQRRSRSRTSHRSKTRQPYLHRLSRRGEVEVWLVEGSWIRTNRNEEFSNFGHHWTFPRLIPRNEIWIDKESDPDEHRFYQSHAFLERRLMAAGQSYESARRRANAHERRLRVAAGDVRKVTAGKDLPQPSKVHTRLWKTLPDGVTVWYVDGRLVRSVFNIEFTEGGHEHVYEFVPHGEVWIDDDLEEDEVGFVLFHELHERALMAGGKGYDEAHAAASKKESYLRKHPAELHQALVDEGWE